MPAPYKTPDVYVEEISVFPPSVAEVETAVPAFIGYTDQARRNADGDLAFKPTKIYSLKEYENLFGGAFDERIDITVARDTTTGALSVSAFTVDTVIPSNATLPEFLLYFAVKMYFDNGGGQCYIVSVGDYANGGGVDVADLTVGLATVALEDEPTLIVIPDAVKLALAAYTTLVQAVLTQCGSLGDRFAIFDMLYGNESQGLLAGNPATTNLARAREAFGNRDLKYGAAYYPYVRTSMNYAADENATIHVTYPPTVVQPGDDPTPVTAILGTLETTNTEVYNFVLAALKERYMIMPPSGAVAGVYAYTDTTRGVWKAPANVSLAGVLEPLIRLDNTLQDPLNVDATSGKSINAIRSFSGKGTLVWGARTLAGNDNEWRYISVRRFFNMVEESIKKSTYWAVFEPNDANTWVKVRGMIENYLTQKWREGALAGATPKDAFFVRCGMGTTMSAIDILEGRMNVEIGMAVVRPAEFVILKFSHKLQTS